MGLTTEKLGRITVLTGVGGGKYPSGNSLLVEDDVRLLVDPSVDLDREGRDAVPGRVDLLLNSHAHEDHFAGNHHFPEAQLVVHEKESRAMSSLQGLMDAYGMDEQAEQEWAKLVVEVFHYQPREDLRAIADGEIIDLGRTRVHCIHAPGHTAGHLVLLFEPDDVLFAADLDLTSFGPYYADARSSLEETISSLEKMRAMSDGLRACISFHEAGVVRDGIGEAIDRYLGVLRGRDQKLLDFLREPRTLDEIADRCIVYGKRYPHISWQPHAEKTMMSMHVRLLQKKGAVEELDDGRFRAA
jgi:glyoxylase-like metal-dependent hydrolase (beta-lactamase superfamily II)